MMTSTLAPLAVGQVAPGLGGCVGELRQPVRQDHQGEVVVAHDEGVGLELVGRLAQRLALRRGLVLRADHLVLLARQHALPGRLRQEAEALRQHAAVGGGEDRVELAGPGRRGILAQAEHGGIG